MSCELIDTEQERRVRLDNIWVLAQLICKYGMKSSRKPRKKKSKEPEFERHALFHLVVWIAKTKNPAQRLDSRDFSLFTPGFEEITVVKERWEEARDWEILVEGVQMFTEIAPQNGKGFAWFRFNMEKVISRYPVGLRWTADVKLDISQYGTQFKIDPSSLNSQLICEVLPFRDDKESLSLFSRRLPSYIVPRKLPMLNTNTLSPNFTYTISPKDLIPTAASLALADSFALEGLAFRGAASQPVRPKVASQPKEIPPELSPQWAPCQSAHPLPFDVEPDRFSRPVITRDIGRKWPPPAPQSPRAPTHLRSPRIGAQPNTGNLTPHQTTSESGRSVTPTRNSTAANQSEDDSFERELRLAIEASLAAKNATPTSEIHEVRRDTVRSAETQAHSISARSSFERDLKAAIAASLSIENSPVMQITESPNETGTVTNPHGSVQSKHTSSSAPQSRMSGYRSSGPEGLRQGDSHSPNPMSDSNELRPSESHSNIRAKSESAGTPRSHKSDRGQNRRNKEKTSQSISGDIHALSGSQDAFPEGTGRSQVLEQDNGWPGGWPGGWPELIETSPTEISAISQIPPPVPLKEEIPHFERAESVPPSVADARHQKLAARATLQCAMQSVDNNAALNVLQSAVPYGTAVHAEVLEGYPKVLQMSNRGTEALGTVDQTRIVTSESTSVLTASRYAGVQAKDRSNQINGDINLRHGNVIHAGVVNLISVAGNPHLPYHGSDMLRTLIPFTSSSRVDLGNSRNMQVPM
ncbi:hypothetical protein BJ508DRAFT_416960 [Ascobolus immersus RN42]|uniref:Uncharacterized protein n=1 Tax=Ascobolus immersus RN42 TaxID=1160509 RepID=A0A3N4I0U0_ASCIM|nr:hypothetical protein BJ508DRAFT_416960 [Ascobolus immersus RN42]